MICFLRHPCPIFLTDDEEPHRKLRTAAGYNLIRQERKTGVLDHVAVRHYVEHGGSSVLVSARTSPHTPAGGNRDRTRLTPDDARHVQRHI